jgi:hypothetical protein
MMLAFAGSASNLHLTKGMLAPDRGDSLLRRPGMCYRTRTGPVCRPASRYALVDHAAGRRTSWPQSAGVLKGPYIEGVASPGTKHPPCGVYQ